MKSKALLILAMVAALVFLIVSASWAAGRIAHRQAKQSERIAKGVRNGKITHREQSRIEEAKSHARADGRLSLQERRRLHRMQDRASKRIYRAKHNQVARLTHRLAYKHLHFWDRPVYYGSHFRGIFAQPSWAFGWSVGWW